jgi:hypothetical protein
MREADDWLQPVTRQSTKQRLMVNRASAETVRSSSEQVAVAEAAAAATARPPVLAAKTVRDRAGRRQL